MKTGLFSYINWRPDFTDLVFAIRAVNPKLNMSSIWFSKTLLTWLMETGIFRFSSSNLMMASVINRSCPSISFRVSPLVLFSSFTFFLIISIWETASIDGCIITVKFSIDRGKSSSIWSVAIAFAIFASSEFSENIATTFSTEAEICWKDLLISAFSAL